MSPDESLYDVEESTTPTTSVPKRNVMGQGARILHPFETSVSSSSGPMPFWGVFLAGDHPLWIVGTEKGGVRIHQCQSSVVHAFTPCTMWSDSEKAEFLMYTDEGPILLEWLSEYHLDGPLPARSLAQGKTYSHVRYDVTTGLLAAAAAVPSKFCLFDEDGTKLWEPDG